MEGNQGIDTLGNSARVATVLRSGLKPKTDPFGLEKFIEKNQRRLKSDEEFRKTVPKWILELQPEISRVEPVGAEGYPQFRFKKAPQVGPRPGKHV